MVVFIGCLLKSVSKAGTQDGILDKCLSQRSFGCVL